MSLLRHVPPASRDSHDTPSAISAFRAGTHSCRSRGRLHLMRRLRLLVAISAGLALAAGAVLPLPTSAEAPRGTAAAPPAPGDAATVRLITGDRVALTRGPDGRRTASVTPGPGRKGLLFRTLEQNGHVTVLPSDADPLVAAGRRGRQAGCDGSRRGDRGRTRGRHRHGCPAGRATVLAPSGRGRVSRRGASRVRAAPRRSGGTSPPEQGVPVAPARRAPPCAPSRRRSP